MHRRYSLPNHASKLQCGNDYFRSPGFTKGFSSSAPRVATAKMRPHEIKLEIEKKKATSCDTFDHLWASRPFVRCANGTLCHLHAVVPESLPPHPPMETCRYSVLELISSLSCLN